MQYIAFDSHKKYTFASVSGEDGFDPSMGARPLGRVIQKHVEDPLSEKVIKGEVKDGDTVVVDVNSKSEIVLKNKKG